MRRKSNFVNMITKEKVCFVRAVKNKEELLFIHENAEYIDKVIKKENESNEIIFLIPPNIKLPYDFKQHYFLLRNSYQGNSRKELRQLFDGMDDFISYCVEHFDDGIRKKNMIFDLQKELQLANKDLQVMSSRYQLAQKIAMTDFFGLNIAKKIVIYGAGAIGKMFYDRIEGFSEVECFIDVRLGGDSYKGVPIISFQEVDEKYNDTVIVVTPTYDMDCIREQLQLRCKNADILSLDDILSNG